MIKNPFGRVKFDDVKNQQIRETQFQLLEAEKYSEHWEGMVLILKARLERLTKGDKDETV